MSFNELNSVEHFIIQKLSGKNLNTADPMSPVVEDDKAVYGSFPWKYRSAAELNRPADQVLLEGEKSLHPRPTECRRSGARSF